MPVTDEQANTLRTLLAGEFEEYRRLLGQLSRESAQSGYAALITAAFFEAVDRRFVEDEKIAESGEVIEYVSTVRARSENAAEQIDPQTAERLIQHSLGEGSIDDIDSDTRFGTEFILLAALVADEELDAAGLDAFLSEARRLGDRLMESA